MEKIVNYLKLLWSKSNRFHRVLLLFILIETHPFPSAKYGFYCNDPALSHPFEGDTITWKWLMAVCGLLPLVVMLLVERIYHKTDKEKSSRRALQWYREYLFGYILNLCLVQLLKHLVGSPRPHFFDTCKPNEATTCEGSEFISSYTCTNAKQWLWQSDKSFPSGHTSLAVHAGFFIVYYLHRRLHLPSLSRALQAAGAAGAVWCGGSRVLDRRHHWWDVLAGAGIGIAILLYTTHNLCKNFDCPVKSDPEKSTSNGDGSIPLEVSS